MCWLAIVCIICKGSLCMFYAYKDSGCIPPHHRSSCVCGNVVSEKLFRQGCTVSNL